MRSCDDIITIGPKGETEGLMTVWRDFTNIVVVPWDDGRRGVQRMRC